MAISLLLAVAWPAQQDYATYVVRQDGGHLRGKVLAIENTSVRFRVPLPGGTAEVTRRLDAFTPASMYRIKKSIAPQNSAEVRIELAAFAADHGLIIAAKRELAAARRLAKDPKLARDLEGRIDEKSAAILLGIFQSRIAQGDTSESRRTLSELLIRYPDSAAAARKTELLASLEDGEKTLRDKHAEEQRLRAAGQRRKTSQKLLGGIRAHVEAGVRANRQGLLSSRRFSHARASFLQATRHFDRAIKACDKALMAHRGEKELSTSLAEASREAKSLLADSLLNVASLCLIRTDYVSATAYVNRVLAMDPKNRSALDMRARIEIAANQPAWYL